MVEIIVASVVGITLGGALGWALRNLQNKWTIKSAKEEAEEILSEAREQVELRQLEEKEKIQEIEMALWTKVEPDMLKLEERIEDLTTLVDEKKSKNDAQLAEERKKSQEREALIKQAEAITKQAEAQLQHLRENERKVLHEYVLKLTEKLSLPLAEAKESLRQQIIADTERWIQKMAQEFEEDTKEHAEVKAKRILALALDRFARAYCPERGISAVNFPDAQVRKAFCDPAGLNIKAVAEATGCDIIVDDSMDMVGVAGFDPVRRELTRRTLERIFKERKGINPDFIKKIAENQKKELFKKIKSDGDNLAKELKLENLNPEVRQMMGSLRYRYSFTQNQYFHCAEVGWLAGLLAAELNLNVRKARRSGMLHDIGKAMDHSVDGGHAVIGADFIEQRNEAPDIVHAVRAHHFDEQPNSDMAFIVIAADAISGARPGARRSTIESYNQKVSELQDIARSFEGVTDCFVLSGGRECRVMVNGRKIDDSASLELAKKIARRIEEECNYPGQIKVVVMREMLVSESTRKEHA